MRRCEIGAQLRDAPAVRAVTYRDGEPQSLRVDTTAEDGSATVAAPDVLLVASHGVVSAPNGQTASAHGVGVLLDSDRDRVLVGSPSGVASLYTRLLYLDGAGTTHFRKVDERTGRWGRVATWAIEW